ncbi:hypothetical protein CROQUDRAFT_54224, partial [Cronartium quercuum f. sp. fusiforme G11]
LAGGAFAFMNVDQAFADNIMLLEWTYNHYVHYVMAEKYKKEQKETGKNFTSNTYLHSFKVLTDPLTLYSILQINWLQTLRFKHSVAQDWPKRYQEMLADVNAHSDDEYSTKHKAYIVRMPVFQSEKANIFMRRVDADIMMCEQVQGKQNHRRHQIRPKHPIESTWVTAPKKLPLDFYDKDWFNKLSPNLRLQMVNSENVMFLSNVNDCLLAKHHPDEKLSSKKFTEKYWDKEASGYDMDHLEVNADEEDSEEEGGEGGDSIDLENTSGGEEEEDDEDYEQDEGMEEDEEEDEEFEGKAMEGDDEELEGEEEGGDGQFEYLGGKGKGDFFVADDMMGDKYDEDDESHALRFDAWNDQ